MSSAQFRKSVLKKLLTDTAIIYTVIVVFLCILLIFLSEGASRAISPLNFLLVLPFSLFFASANYIEKHTRLNAFLKFVIHAVFTVGGFFCFLYLPAFSDNSQSGSFVVFIVFAALYLAVYGVIQLFRRRWRKELSAESAYKPQFKHGDD